MRGMTKRELVTVFVLAGVIAAIAVVWLGLGAVRANLDMRAGDGGGRVEQGRDEVFRKGEWAQLDSRADEKPLPNGDGYAAYLGWKGRMDVVIDDAKIVTGREAKSELKNEYWFADDKLPDDDASILVVSARFKNVDAETEYTTLGGHKWFFADFLRLKGAVSLAYFDGRPEGAMKEEEGNFFVLPKGQTASYVMAYHVPAGAKLADLYLYAGMANLESKYRFELG